MKLRDYVDPLFKWWWLIAAATIVALLSGFLVTRDLPPVYVARASVMVGRGITEPNPSDYQLNMSHQLANTYAELARREPIANATMAALGLDKLPDYEVGVIYASTMVEITVTDTNPARASAVANELANQLILQSPTSSERTDQQRQAFVDQQLDEMQAQILTVSQEITQKQADIQQMSSAAQIEEARVDLAALETKLSLLQSNYATLLANSQEGAINILTLVEPATVPSRPIGPNKLLILGLVGVIGVVISAGAAHLLEFLDKSLKTPEDISRALGLPVIGYVKEMEPKKDHLTYVVENPHSPLAEAFRALRTNIEFSSTDKPIRSILITSPGVGDGKTTLSVNLALLLAQGDRKVLLIDGDLRRPRIHEGIDFTVQPGLTDVLRGMNIFDAVRQWKDMKVGVMTAGSPVTNPSELLGSRKMEAVLGNLEAVFDLIVIDSPPSIVTDSLVLASKVDGVVLVVRPGQTRSDVAKSTVDAFHRGGANVLGVVLNRISSSKARGYSGYGVYSPYYTDSRYFESGTKIAVSNPPPVNLTDTPPVPEQQ